MDIVSISAILNLLWYICTIVFFIYKFTNFFSRMHTVYRVVLKVKTGFVWLKNKMFGIRPHTSYHPIATDEIDYHIPSQSEDLQSKVDIEAPSVLFSQFVNRSGSKYNKTQQQKNKNDDELSTSNALLEIGMFLPFYTKHEPEDEEIPLVESHYLDVNE
jgi:hypothetical protein